MKPTDRKLLYRDMQEEPDKYSDQEIEAMMDDLDQVPDIEEAWQQFESEELRVKSLNSKLLKIAASFIGLLFVSGMAIAAIHIVRQSRQPQPQEKTVTTTANSQLSTLNSQLAKQDSLPQPRLYDNVPLGEILSELSAYYNIKVEYRTEDAPRLRLFYNWKPEYSLEKVIEMLNNFEWLELELENDTLYVKSTAIPAHDC
ncbi:MAG: DUF4974 domain-containing protein [Prevotella sp.]|nr:DUF4974 domain-containing protein [Prevotella sp.]